MVAECVCVGAGLLLLLLLPETELKRKRGRDEAALVASPCRVEVTPRRADSDGWLTGRTWEERAGGEGRGGAEGGREGEREGGEASG